MANEGKVSLTAEVDFSGLLNGTQEVNNALQDWKANLDIVSGSMLALANSGSSFSLLESSISGVVSTIKFAAEAQGIWNATMAVFASSTGFGIAVAAIGATVGILQGLLASSQEAAKRLGDTLSTVGQSATDFNNGISTAGSYLSAFNDQLFASSDEQANLKSNMQEIQNGITTICRTASDERRGLTESEIQTLDTYFSKLNELSQREFEIEQSKLTAIEQQATNAAQNHNMSADEYAATAQKWINTAKQQCDKQIELAENQAVTELALLNGKYKDKATLDNQAYKNEYDVIMNSRDANVRAAKESIGNVTAAFTEGYSKQEGVRKAYTKKSVLDNISIESEQKRHSSEIDKISNNSALSISERNIQMEAKNRDYRSNLGLIWMELEDALSETEKEQIGVYLALAANTDLYGGKVNESTQNVTTGILDSFDKMPKSVKDMTTNLLQPMLDSMQTMEPKLFAQANSIAGGVLQRMRFTFEEHSPSKASRRIFKNLMKGAELGMEDETDKLYRQTDDMANGVLDSAQEAMDIHSPSRVTRDELGKPIVEGIAVGIAEGGDEVSDALQKVMDELDLQRDLGLTSDEEYYAQMERYRDEYLTKGTKEWWNYTKDIMKFKADSLVEAFDKQEEADQKAQDRMERRGELTHEREMELLADRAQRYRDMAQEVSALEGLTQEERLDLYEKYAEKAADLDDEMTDKARENQKKLSDAVKERFEQDRSREEMLFAFRKKMNGVSFEEEQGYLKARASKYRAFSEQALLLEGYTQQEKLELQKGYLEKAEELDRQHLENQKDRLDSVAGKIKSTMKLYTKATFKEGFAEPDYQMENGVYVDQNAKLSNGVVNLPDYKAQTEQLDQYSNAIQQLKDRLAETGATLSEDFYTELYSMDTGDATLFLQKLASQSDQAFEEFAAYENKRSETANSRAAQILGIDLDSFKQAVADMLAQPAAENPDALSPESLGIDQGQTEEQYAALGDNMKASLLEHFEQVPEGFLDIGGDAAQQFADGFVQKLEAIKLQIQSAVAGIMPPVATAAGANASYQYVTNYNFAASAHEPLSRQIQTARDADTVNRLRGIG